MRSSPESERWASPAAALETMLAKLEPVGTETVSCSSAVGRVLAEPVIADRASPAYDVSSMDGYAICLADRGCERLPVAGEVLAGQAPGVLPLGKTIRINTGAALPQGADAVVKREDVVEQGDHIVLPAGAEPMAPGLNIRHRGENADEGEQVLFPGTLIIPPVMAALASFGKTQVAVHRQVRVGTLVTGDEVLPPDLMPVQPWQLRDANGPALRALLADRPNVMIEMAERVPDEPGRIRSALRELLERCEAVLITGGVSMGTRDEVPAILQSIGAQVVFHRLPIRPGKPILGAVGPGGQAILALPGNPVSVMVTARRFGLPVLAKRSGIHHANLSVPRVLLADAADPGIPLWWYRLVRWVEPGVVELVANRGSGDFVAAARSDGFVECPPHAAGPGPWPFYPWT